MPSTDAVNATDCADHADLGDLGLDEGGHLLIDRGSTASRPAGGWP